MWAVEPKGKIFHFNFVLCLDYIWIRDTSWLRVGQVDWSPLCWIMKLCWTHWLWLHYSVWFGFTPFCSWITSGSNSPVIFEPLQNGAYLRQPFFFHLMDLYCLKGSVFLGSCLVLVPYFPGVTTLNKIQIMAGASCLLANTTSFFVLPRCTSAQLCTKNRQNAWELSRFWRVGVLWGSGVAS